MNGAHVPIPDRDRFQIRNRRHKIIRNRSAQLSVRFSRRYHLRPSKQASWTTEPSGGLSRCVEASWRNCAPHDM